METNNITLAPTIPDTESIYALWRKKHIGDKEDFYRFMTVPGFERNIFLGMVDSEHVFTDGFITYNIIIK